MVTLLSDDAAAGLMIRTRIHPLRILAGAGLAAASACSDRRMAAVAANACRNSLYACRGDINAFAALGGAT